MIVGIVAISQDGYYLDEAGNLPPRTDWDKDLLYGLCADSSIVCSKNTLATLPKSLVKVCTRTITSDKQPILLPDVNLGISSFEGVYRPELLIVVRHEGYLGGGRELKLNRYYRILKLQELELWKLKI